MAQGTTNLHSFRNEWYKPGSAVKRAVWIVLSAIFFRHSLAAGSNYKRFILRMLGAKIGKGVVIKPSVQIKYPWKLSVGDHSWIGEHVWIDNLAEVNIGAHCCISQGALILCGNHDYTKSAFDLIIHPIIIENGVWVGAKSIVAPGAHLESHCVLSAGSCASGKLEAYSIYRGNPAIFVRQRTLTQS